MRPINYLSPTSIALWDENREEFYLRYLADERPPGMPQTQAMAIGSAFDAYAKNYLHECLYGKGFNPRFELIALIEAQVEHQHRDWAITHGRYAFNQYKQAGCVADLMLELRKAQSDPRFEFDAMGVVNGYREGMETHIGEVTLMGKPDVHFINHAGATVILDFKVNGYCSANGISPIPGYIRCRSAGATQHKMHRDCQPMNHRGMMINVNKYLEQQDAKWAQQLAIYAWLCGDAVGSDFLVAIDQLACSPNPGGLPSIRVAEHRTRVSKNFQWQVFNKAAEIWETVHSDHLFRDLTKAQSREKCASLDRRSRELRGEGSANDNWFSQITRG